MPFTCATCFQALSTTTSLKRHVRWFHPNMNEEQIMCKTCNMPCTDKYNLKRHNTRFHRDEIPALGVASIEHRKKRIHQMTMMWGLEKSNRMFTVSRGWTTLEEITQNCISLRNLVKRNVSRGWNVLENIIQNYIRSRNLVKRNTLSISESPYAPNRLKQRRFIQKKYQTNLILKAPVFLYKMR